MEDEMRDEDCRERTPCRSPTNGRRAVPLDLDPDVSPMSEWRRRLEEIAARSRPRARQAALLRIVWREAYLTREGLIARVEALLGGGCFGREARETFHRDLCKVREMVSARGYVLQSRRGRFGPEYYVAGRPELDESLERRLAGSIAEVDPRQIAIYAQLSPAQRVRQLGQLSDWLRHANRRRIARERAQQTEVATL